MPLASGPCSTRRATSCGVSSLHLPTTTANESCPDPVPSSDVAIGTLSALSAEETVLQADLRSGAHWSVVGSLRPAEPCANGSGYAPTTARTVVAAVVSWRSHQTESPAWT